MALDFEMPEVQELDRDKANWIFDIGRRFRAIYSHTFHHDIAYRHGTFIVGDIIRTTKPLIIFSSWNDTNLHYKSKELDRQIWLQKKRFLKDCDFFICREEDIRSYSRDQVHLASLNRGIICREVMRILKSSYLQATGGDSDGWSDWLEDNIAGIHPRVARELRYMQTQNNAS